MRVKILYSAHSQVQVGMEGEAVWNPELEGWEVTFTEFTRENAANHKITEDLTILCKKDEIEFLA